MMNISRAEFVDLGRILEIQKAAYQSEAALYNDTSIPPLLQTLEELQAEYNTCVILKAVTEEGIIGSVRLRLEDEVALLGRLIVDPMHQGKGYGSALLDAADSVFPQATCIELFTGSRSERNIGIYERHGYVRTREAQLSSKVTLVYLRKQISRVL